MDLRLLSRSIIYVTEEAKIGQVQATQTNSKKHYIFIGSVLWFLFQQKRWPTKIQNQGQSQVSTDFETKSCGLDFWN